MRKGIIGSPFEQFEIQRIVPLELGGALDVSITNSTVYMALAVAVYMVLYKINIEQGKVVPGRWQGAMEITYSAIVSMVMENIGEGKYVGLIWAIFINIAIMNMIGLVPYTFTPTAHIVIGLGMSVSILIGVTLLGVENYGVNYLAMMMPGGSPLGLAPLLVMIELVSQLAKGVSLGVRLAANIMAGHLLFAILAGFAFNMLVAGGIITAISIFPILLVVFITVLECGVALIQAYVFSILTTIYINDAIHIH